MLRAALAFVIACGLALGGVVLVLVFGLMMMVAANAEGGVGSWWEKPVVRACCSVADALYADEWHAEGDEIVATVTGGGPMDHDWAPIGRVYRIPKEKVRGEPGNPTGRALLFVSPYTLEPYCFFFGPLI